MNIAVVALGVDPAEHMYEGIGDRAGDLTGAWTRVLPQLQAEERLIFTSHGHGQWPHNRPGTIAKKGRDERNVDTGTLFSALVRDTGRGAVRRKGRTQTTFGVNDNSIFWARFVGGAAPFIVDDDTARDIGSRGVMEWLVGDAS